VDDLITASTTLAEIKKFKEEIKMKFKMFDLGLLTFYIGLEVQQSSSGIVLCQTHYVVRILEETCMTECTSNHAIMEERLIEPGQRGGGGRDFVPQAHQQRPLFGPYMAGFDLHHGIP
jgi:hypothetical protein